MKVTLVIVFKGGGHVQTPIPLGDVDAVERLLIEMINAKSTTVKYAGNHCMYVPCEVAGFYFHDTVSAVERMAKAMEKEVSKGEEWKGEDDK